MKKCLSMFVFGGFVVTSINALAADGPILYGKANVSYENQDDGNSDTWKLQSNASRLGVKVRYRPRRPGGDIQGGI